MTAGNTKNLFKIINKLAKLNAEIANLGSEDIGYKIQHILYYVQQLKTDTLFTEEIQRQFKLASDSIVGILSTNSRKRLQMLLNEMHAYLKAHVIIEQILEQNFISDEDIEFYEDLYIDSDTGEVSEETNTHIRDKLFSLLKTLNKKLIDLDGFLLKIRPVFEFSINRIKESSEQYYSKMRQKLSEDTEGFADKNVANTKELKRQYRSSKLFFQPEKSQLSTLMLANRTTAVTTTLPLTKLSARQIISAATLSLKQTTEYYKDKVPPLSREKAAYGPTTLSWQNKPSECNLGNLFIAGLGSYGFYSSKGEYDSQAVLSLIYDITNPFSKNYCMSESNLASYMLRFCSSGLGISTHDLGLQFNNKNQKKADRINRVLFLTSCAEIWRYTYTSKIEHAITKIAFANAHARVLQLLEEEQLSMRDVFDEDASFGLPTGKQLIKNVPNIIKKFLDINDLYNSTDIIGEETFSRKFPQGGICSFTARHMRELRDTYHKEGQVEAEYYSSDEETNNYPGM